MNLDNTIDIVGLALLEYQKFLCGLHSVERDTTKFGVPPKSLIVKQHDRYDSIGHFVGNIISAWRVFHDMIKRVDISCKAEIEPQDGMFYNEGTGYFSLSPNQKFMNLGWHYGRLYGRGFRYKIIKGDSVSLEIYHELWIS